MISSKVMNNLGRSSWIRAMFEEGEKLRKIHGAENVFDFSLGNPDVEPPMKVKDTLKKLALEDKPGMHNYMSNAGYKEVRERVASYVAKETGVPVTYEKVIMSVGAGGGLNVVLKAILNEGEEVIVLAPFFAEYTFYIENHGGKMVVVPTNKETFEPDPELLSQFITEKTKAIIINTPNNPTGVVYSESILEAVAFTIAQKEKEFGTEIFVLSDEPYGRIIYDGKKAPNVLGIFKNSIKVDSFSKSLSLPGERIGYIVANPGIKDIELLMSAMIFTTRTLGFVNAPALFQKVIYETIEEESDVEAYKVRRDWLYENLTSIGYECIKPQGAFYLFIKSPIDDDVAFVKKAVDFNLLIVPGTGFGCPGYFRISYCVGMDTIKNSIPAFKKLLISIKNQ